MTIGQLTVNEISSSSIVYMQIVVKIMKCRLEGSVQDGISSCESDS
jgi:hypothetical protein